MKLGELTNAWGPTIAALVAVVAFVEWKTKLPDEIEPATVYELHQSTAPLTEGDKRDAYNWALRNIPYAWGKLCDNELDEIQIASFKRQLETEYENHLWGGEYEHRYEGMTDAQICAERQGE